VAFALTGRRPGADATGMRESSSATKQPSASAAGRLRSWPVIFTAGLALAGIVGTALHAFDQESDHAALQQSEATQRIAERIANHVDQMGVAAAAAQGLFLASKSVERDEWDAFAGALRSAGSLDGSTNLGFAQRVPRAALAEFVHHVRADGASEFAAVGPLPDGAETLVLLRYRSAPDNRGLALGAELSSNPTLDRACRRSTETGAWTVAELVADGRSPRDRRLIGCMPVFAKGKPLATAAERALACEGWIIAGVRLLDVLEQARNASLGLDASTSVLMSERHGATGPPIVCGGEWEGREASVDFVIGDRGYRLTTVRRAPSPGATIAAIAPQLGIAIALGSLLTAVVWTLAGATRRSQALAVAMTRDLRQSDARMQVFIEHAAAAVAMFDLQMRYMTFSRRWLTDYGLDHTILGRSHYDVFPEIPERWKEVHRHCLAGSVERCEADPFDRADGTRQWLRWDVRPWRSDDGSIGGLMMFTEDITADLEATRVRETTVAVLNGITAGRPLQEVLALITNLAESLDSDLRASVLLLRDDKLYSVESPSLPAAYSAAIQGIAIGPEVGSCGTAAWRRELVVCSDVWTDPKWANWIELARKFELRSCWSMPIFGGTGNATEPASRLRRVIGTLAMYHRTPRTPTAHQVRLAQDLAHLAAVAIERWQSAEALRQSLAELEAARGNAEAANLAKSEFLANMSHEIRTPMTAILGFADVLADDEQHPLTTSQRRDALDAIRRNGDHLLAIINDVLDLSKIEAGKMTIERLAVEPMQVVQDVVSLLAERADAQGIQLEVAADGDLPRAILTDPTRLRQILLNLVGNAIKFTHRGSVRVTADVVATNADAPMLRIRVTDTGVGMTASQAASLFGAFVQADTSTTRRFGGTGLGLRISKRLAAMLGGDIQVESAEGVGSTFTVTIPAQATDLPVVEVGGDAATRQPSGSRSLAGARILLAEDGRDNQRLITLLLRRLGATVTVAENGKLAVGSLCEAGDLQQGLQSPTPFDLVLLDMQMPEMDGYAAAALLREKGFAGPVIALTANALSGDRERCLAAGCDDYVRKPVNRDELFVACDRALGARAS